jgi:hypothetical protein
MAVASVVACEIVNAAKIRAHANRDRFFADVLMHRAANAPLVPSASCGMVERANEMHRSKHFKNADNLIAARPQRFRRPHRMSAGSGFVRR